MYQQKSVYRSNDIGARDKQRLRVETELRWFLQIDTMHHLLTALSSTACPENQCLNYTLC